MISDFDRLMYFTNMKQNNLKIVCVIIRDFQCFHRPLPRTVAADNLWNLKNSRMLKTVHSKTVLVFFEYMYVYNIYCI